MADWKEKMILSASATEDFDKEKADKVLYDFNFKKDLKI